MKKSTLMLITGCIIVFLNLVIIITSPGGLFSNITGYIFAIISSFSSVAGLIFALKVMKEKQIKLIYLLLLSGMFFYFLGECTYAIMDLIMKINMNEAFPALPDFFWVTGYIPLFSGMVITIKLYKEKTSIRAIKSLKYLFTILLIPFLAGFIYIFLMPIIEDPKTTFLAKFVYLFYPIGDLFLIACSFLIFYIARFSHDKNLLSSWKYIASGFIFITLADIIYSYMTWRGTYNTSEFIDASWNAGYFLIGIGALKMAEVSKTED
jgi:hypothetical protein